MTETSTNILLVILGIGTLIFVHELGHFLAAKWIGVKVHVFSMGFGPALWSRVWGETDYRLSAIPLGGYVKLAGEHPEKEAPLAPGDFMAKPAHQRALVLLAGVGLNALLAFIAFVIAFQIGVPFITSEIGEVSTGWPAWETGLKPGDKIVRLNGKRNPDFEDIFTSIALGSPAAKISLLVERDNQLLGFTVSPRYDEAQGMQRIGISPALSREIGHILQYPDGSPSKEAGLKAGDEIIAINGEGVEAGEKIREIEANNPGKELTLTVLRQGEKQEVKVTPLSTPRWMLGVSCASTKIQSLQQESLAAKVGLKKGDVLLKVNGKEVSGWTALKSATSELPTPGGKTPNLTLKRGKEVLSLDVPGDARNLLEGVVPAMGLRVDHVVEGFPAQELGIRPGDELLSLRGEGLKRWEDLLRIIATCEGKEMEVQWRRGSGTAGDKGGETFTARFRPRKDTEGAMGRLGIRLKEKSVEKQYGFIGACQAGTHKAIVMTQRIYLSMKALLTRQVSSETVGGIIMIAQATYESAKLGMGKLLYFIGILSLQLAILNALPIPMLDGGHLLFLGIEKIKGSPLSERTMAFAQYIGMALLLALLLFATRNDVMRLLAMYQ
ncbi:MAG TPA: RIP metalloprotease RseP [Candidatus Tripitaka californicus]|uniref:RIP metalloprotease RseP n=1 Tax=Candidatus Tripitaka californicus TaxID=3367616 RepID=UPI0040250AA6|nr:RIP metalloprotease RseP [Planctomycetota bacterium]